MPICYRYKLVVDVILKRALDEHILADEHSHAPVEIVKPHARMLPGFVRLIMREGR